jgi:hypothetical protein
MVETKKYLLLLSPKTFDVSITGLYDMKYVPTISGGIKRVSVQSYCENEYKRLGRDVVRLLNEDKRNIENGLSVEIGESRELFRMAYLSKVDSCMGFAEFSHICSRKGLNIQITPHPAESYASGDFEIILIKSNEEIIGRMVCCKKSKSASSAYSILGSDGAFIRNSLRAIASSIGYKAESIGKTMAGARLLKIKTIIHFSESIAIPFIDSLYNYSIKDAGDHLVISNIEDHEKDVVEYASYSSEIFVEVR